MDLTHARVVCEACFLGVASEGLTPALNPSVQGVGIGNKLVHHIATEERALQVFVDRKRHERFLKPEHRIPAEIEGVPTDVVETGIFSIGRKFPPIYQRRVRPAPAGVSIGHYQVSAGTFGALVREGGDVYILSNNHVLANEGRAQEGDPILQPGKYDGGRVDRDTIAHLADSVTLEAEATNTVDAAIATPVVRDEVAPELLHIGRVRGEADPGSGVTAPGLQEEVVGGKGRELTGDQRGMRPVCRDKDPLPREEESDPLGRLLEESLGTQKGEKLLRSLGGAPRRGRGA